MLTPMSSLRILTAAGAYPVTCTMGVTGRTALRSRALKLRVVTTFTPVAGAAVSSTRTITAKRRR